MARTLDPALDGRIHVAVLRSLQRDGLAGLTVDRVAALAGVGKAAIYRRYRSKADLIAGAVAAELPIGEPPAELTGAEALAAIVEDLRVALFQSGGLPVLAALLVAQAHHGELLTVWRQRIVEPRVAIIRRVLRRSGIVTAADAQIVGELALGGLIARYVARGEVTPAAARALAQRLWQLPVGLDRPQPTEDSP